MWPSWRYRYYLRTGVRLFDSEPSVLMPGERISYMTMDDLEAACELLGLDLSKMKPSYR